MNGVTFLGLPDVVIRVTQSNSMQESDVDLLHYGGCLATTTALKSP